MQPGDFPEVVDSSMLATLKQCPQLFNLLYVEQWKPKELSVHLHAGAAFAKGIEVAREKFYIGGATAEEAEAAGIGALLKAYGNFECPPDSAKSCERMAGALEFYFERYPLERGLNEPITLPGGKRGIEMNFAEPLPVVHPVTGNPIIYCGRLDAVLDAYGGIFMCDEKTTTSLGPTWSRQWDLRAQFTGYKWGLGCSGIHVDGAIVRGVSILKTKYDTQEVVSYRPDWQVERWLEEMCQWLELAKTMWAKRKFLHNLDHACGDFGGCTFRQVCMTLEPANWLDTYFERRHWDPITRKETKL